jgi:hypothetical protein
MPALSCYFSISLGLKKKILAAPAPVVAPLTLVNGYLAARAAPAVCVALYRREALAVHDGHYERVLGVLLYGLSL